MVDAAEYGDSCTAKAGVRDAASTGSKDSANKGADASEVGCEVLAAGESGGELKFGLGGLAGEGWRNLLCVGSEDAASEDAGNSDDVIDGAAAGVASPSAFFHWVDVPQFSQ